ncbi:MAG: polyphenol oxidase family protein [Acidimicrobiales bacterium]
MLAAGRAAGDFADPASDEALRAEGRLVAGPWTWLRQVHGAGVVVAEHPGGCRGAEGDAAVTACPEAALAVRTADCAPLALSSPEGVAGIVHAGWRGLMAGVVGGAVAAMRELGAGTVAGALGPCIRPHAYRFSPSDLGQVVARFGQRVGAVDASGWPALDLPAAIAAALEEVGAGLAADAGTCTHCSDLHWSWRARADKGRQVTLVWVPPTAGPPPAGPPPGPGATRDGRP